MSLSSSCHPLVVNKPHPHSCCGASLQRQCLYFILIITLFKEDNIFGTDASLTYGPQIQRHTCV